MKQWLVRSKDCTKITTTSSNITTSKISIRNIHKKKNAQTKHKWNKAPATNLWFVMSSFSIHKRRKDHLSFQLESFLLVVLLFWHIYVVFASIVQKEKTNRHSLPVCPGELLCLCLFCSPWLFTWINMYCIWFVVFGMLPLKIERRKEMKKKKPREMNEWNEICKSLGIEMDECSLYLFVLCGFVKADLASTQCPHNIQMHIEPQFMCRGDRSLRTMMILMLALLLTDTQES